MHAIVAEIARYRRFILTAHEKPDGDAVGAVLGLVRILRARGCEATAAGLAPMPRRYGPFVGESEVFSAQYVTDELLSKTDCIIALDAGTAERCPRFVLAARGRVPILNIDHHGSNSRFGDANWVDPAASSVGEMVFLMAKAAGWPVPRDAAEALWIALVTDTGRFAYSNTTPTTLQVASELLAIGVDTASIDRQIYQSFTARELALQAKAMESLELHEDGQVAFVSLSTEDFSRAGSGPEDAEDVANIPRSVGGVRISAFLYEIEKRASPGTPPVVQTKVSLRTVEPYDGAAFCQRFGGGGHARAAGCTLPVRVREARTLLLQELRKAWFGC